MFSRFKKERKNNSAGLTASYCINKHNADTQMPEIAQMPRSDNSQFSPSTQDTRVLLGGQQHILRLRRESLFTNVRNLSLTGV